MALLLVKERLKTELGHFREMKCIKSQVCSLEPNRSVNRRGYVLDWFSGEPFVDPRRAVEFVGHVGIDGPSVNIAILCRQCACERSRLASLSTVSVLRA
jgi:hypothetical protein